MWRSVTALRWVQLVGVLVWGLALLGGWLLDDSLSGLCLGVQVLAMAACFVALGRMLWLLGDPRRSRPNT